MKKTILSIVFSFTLLGAFAQWNNTGDSKTTGSLTVGSTVEGSYSHLTILGPNGSLSEAGKRDIIFQHKDAGRAVIRSIRSGGWGNGLQFLTTKNSPNPEMRMSFNEEQDRTTLYDKRVMVGDIISGRVGEGSKLILSGTDLGHGEMAIYNYAKSLGSQDLRISLGESLDSYRFLVGRTANNIYVPLFAVHSNGNVGIGLSDTQSAAYKLDVNGVIRAKEIRVETGWADFVFRDDYKLPTLQEVKAHIDEHKHLPGMPSETEVKENGVGLADATTKLLQKVEELTLYAIQQQELIDKLTKEVDNLKNTEK